MISKEEWWLIRLSHIRSNTENTNTNLTDSFDSDSNSDISSEYQQKVFEVKKKIEK